MVRRIVSILLLMIVARELPAQVTYPARPETYQVTLRYRIRADRDERIRQFRTLEADLKAVGFVRTRKPNDDLDVFDPDAENLTGTIPGSKLLNLVAVENIKTVIAFPEGVKLPDDGTKLVQLRISLNGTLGITQQRQFHRQVVEHLKLLKFVEAVGYDDTRAKTVRGAIPASQVMNLLKDLRSLPSGWLFSDVPRDEIPSPLSGIMPIRLVEILPDIPADASVTPVAPSDKLSPEIAAVLADPMLAEKPLVVEVNLETDSPDLTAEMRTPLESVVLGSTIEGYVGRFATVRLPKASDVLQLAKYSEARMIRLPPRASETAANDDSEAPVPTIPSVIEKTNLATLQGLGHRGQGVRVVVIGSEFPGLEVVTENQPTYPGLVKVKTAGIPKAWFYDFTAEPNPDVQPLPASANPNLSAIAAATALAGTASEAHVLLVRVDPSAFHQMQSIARAVLGTAGYTLALQARLSEISVESQRLLARRRVVVEEYRRAFTDLSDDEIPTKRREAATIAMKKVQADEALLKARIDRFLNLKQGLESLAGSRIVLNTLVWEEGQPHDSLSPLSQLIESAFANGAARSAIKPDRNPPPPVWIQAASTDRGQIWSGPFMDPDQNQVLNLSAEQSKLPVGRWTNELNFLSYEAVGAAPTSTIPQGTKVRIAVQWREPHNRDTFLIDEPSFPLTLRLFRQIDPTGKVHATDDLVEVARSAGIPARLLKTPGSGVYETILETTLPVDGVYALRIEGGLKGLNVVPAARLGFEIRPRVALTTGDRTKGRVTFETFLPEQSGVGIPADASEAITVGARIGDKLLSLTGAGPGIELRTKPEIYSTPRILVGNQAVQGSAVSAGYTAGIGACLASLGVRKADVTSSIGIKAGSDLILPLDWLRTFPPLRSK